MMALRAFVCRRLAIAACCSFMATMAAAQIPPSGEVTFTPQVGPLPDVVLGDQTPLNNLQPGDITSPADTLENQPPSANVFTFPNAFNLFDLVSDVPRLPGYTSDELLVYEFMASPVTPETGPAGASSDARISINGTTILTTPTQILFPTRASAEVTFADVELSGKPDPLRTVGTLTYSFGEFFHPTNTTTPVSVTGDLVDVNAITLRVTNLVSNSASDEILFYTVNDGPDALRGILGPPPHVDLLGWTYDGAGAVPQLGGPALSYPGDTTVTGRVQMDDDGDASVSDLNIAIPGLEGQSFVNFYSPGGMIPFIQDGTYRIAWTASRSDSFASDAAVPVVRFRTGYGLYGDLGNSLLNAPGVVAPPSTAGRHYDVILDELDVASASGAFTFTVPPTPENSIQLFFETIDFESTVGGGAVELDDLSIDSLDREALLAQGSPVRSVSDFRESNPDLGVVPPLQSTRGDPVTVAQEASRAVIFAPFLQGMSTFTDNFGFALAINTGGLGLVPFAPSAETERRFYRAEFGLDASASTASTPLPMIQLTIATFNPGQRFTSQFNIQPLRSALLGGGANPGLQSHLFAAYLVLPSEMALAPTTGTPPQGLGNQIGASVALIDSSNQQGGPLVIDALSISSYPESLLP